MEKKPPEMRRVRSPVLHQRLCSLGFNFLPILHQTLCNEANLLLCVFGFQMITQFRYCLMSAVMRHWRAALLVECSLLRLSGRDQVDDALALLSQFKTATQYPHI